MNVQEKETERRDEIWGEVTTQSVLQWDPHKIAFSEPIMKVGLRGPVLLGNVYLFGTRLQQGGDDLLPVLVQL